MEKKFVNWELMWKFVGVVLIGLFLILIGLFNFYNWSSISRYSALVVGIILFGYGLWRVKERSKGI